LLHSPLLKLKSGAAVREAHYQACGRITAGGLERTRRIQETSQAGCCLEDELMQTVLSTDMAHYRKVDAGGRERARLYPPGSWMMQSAGAQSAMLM